jgi:hypothetical protein
MKAKSELDQPLSDCDEAVKLDPKNVWAYFSRSEVKVARVTGEHFASRSGGDEEKKVANGVNVDRRTRQAQP